MATSESEDHLVKVEFEAGETVFNEGDPAQALYVVDSGSVVLTKRVHREDCHLERVRVGDVFGTHALFPDMTYQCRAVAQQATRCLRVLGPQFEKMVKGNPEIAFRFIRKLATRLIHSQFRQTNFALRTPLARLVHQLQAEQRRAGDEVLPIPFDLPEVLSIERGEIDAMMRMLVRHRLIELGKEAGTFLVPDQEAFDRFLAYLELRDRFERVEALQDA